MASFRRDPTLPFKLLAACLVIFFYFMYLLFRGSESIPRVRRVPSGPKIQTRIYGPSKVTAFADEAERVKEAMKYTFWKYRENVWGYDDIMPVSGMNKTSRNGWGVFIVDTASTLALMGLWDELSLSVDHIIDKIDFTTTAKLVDPFETTIRYLGGLVSLVDLVDAGIIPRSVVSVPQRDSILQQAIVLADKLAPAYNSPSGMPWPRVNFTTNKPERDPPAVYKYQPDKRRYKNPSIGPARAGSNILENRVLTRLSGNNTYFSTATYSWAPMVWNRWIEDWPGMVDAPIDIFTTEPVGRERHWDAGHDSYYEYLIKAAILSPGDRYSSVYQTRWTQAADALRTHLATRTTPTDTYKTQHLMIGRHDGGWYLNQMSHLACFAPGNLMLGGRYLDREDLIVFGQALLEACRHSYNATTTGIGPETFSWTPMETSPNATFSPQTDRQFYEIEYHGFWLVDPRYRLRPEYVESLFYAWRITGQERYRHWAWEAFSAIEKHCKTEYGYAAIADVMAAPDKVIHLDESESFWGAETLKYLYLTFADTELGTLDAWVYSTEGHPFRMIR